MSPSCEATLFGPTRNPWSLTHSTSGSSGGSAGPVVAAGIVPIGHGNDLGGSLRYPASNCGLFGLKPTRARNPLGPEYGDAISGWAVEHAITRSVRDSAALLDATSGPMAGDPYSVAPPARAFVAEVGANPGRLRIGFTGLTDGGALVTPTASPGSTPRWRCSSSGTRSSVPILPPFTEQDGQAIGVVFNSATAWILDYWITPARSHPCSRRARTPHVAPFGRWASGRRPPFLRSIETLHRYSWAVAARFAEFDVFLTPTGLGAAAASRRDDDVYRGRPFPGLAVGGTTVAYSGVVANLTGDPGHVVAVALERGKDCPSACTSWADSATRPPCRLAGQLEQARPWADQPVEPVHPVLEPGPVRVAGPHMLDEQELTTRPQHPAQLPQRPRLIIYAAQHQR